MTKQIAAKLGFLPLALTQAGSYISYTKIPLEKYITLLDGSFRTFANQGGPEWLSARRPGNPNRTILTTWEISFASLSAPAQQLLLLCGSLANADIPDRLFEGSKLPFDWVPGEGTEKLPDLGLSDLTSNRKRVASRVTRGAFPLLPGETECVK
jgi:hypothetical protein